MKIRLTIEVDEKKWAQRNAIEPAHVRADVITFLRETLTSVHVPLTIVDPR